MIQVKVNQYVSDVSNIIDSALNLNLEAVAPYLVIFQVLEESVERLRSLHPTYTQWGTQLSWLWDSANLPSRHRVCMYCKTHRRESMQSCLLLWLWDDSKIRTRHHCHQESRLVLRMFDVAIRSFSKSVR